MAKDPPPRGRSQWRHRAALVVTGAMIMISAIPSTTASAAGRGRAQLPPQPGGSGGIKKNPALSHGALNEAVQGLDRVLQDRKGPMTQARSRALSLDDRARVLQDKGRLFKDRSALSAARADKDKDRDAQVAFDRSTLITDRARLLEDKGRMFSDRAKIITERAATQAGIVPDVPRGERGAVAVDDAALYKDRARTFQDKALLLRDSGHLVADYGGEGEHPHSKMSRNAVREDKGMLHEDHGRLRKDFSAAHRDREQLQRDEHYQIRQKGESDALKFYNANLDHPLHSRAAAGGSWESGKVKMYMAGLCGLMLVLVGLYTLIKTQRKQTRLGASDPFSDSPDRIPLKGGAPRGNMIPKGSRDSDL